MSDFNFIFYNKNTFTFDQIFHQLIEINQVRFDSKIILEKSTGNKIIFKYYEIADLVEIKCNINSKHELYDVLVFSQPDHPWLNYVEMVFRNELAMKLQGRVQVGEEGLVELPLTKSAASKTYLEFCRFKVSHITLHSNYQFDEYVSSWFECAPNDMTKY